MKNFIEELYYGNIDPQNSGFEDDESVRRELQTISENEDWLTASSPASGWERGLCWIPSYCQRLLHRTICRTKNKTCPCLDSARQGHILF